LDFNVGTDVSDTVITFSAGVSTSTYVMPATGQQVVLSYTGGAGLSGTQTADSVTVTVLDPAEEAANSALDAAQEATDAAIAATDAAILAQEAADEAASAAIAAQETAQAAVDAVTALSAEVTKLVAQLATLQKLLNRVAKRVGVKL
jgi:D-arabinose 1-dehydrogenase-like Zn-dependent alcohol dehydrogenase